MDNKDELKAMGIVEDTEKEYKDQIPHKINYSNTTPEGRNKIARSLHVFSLIVFVCGFIAGLFLAVNLESPVYFIIFSLGSYLSLLFIDALAEIVQLLQDIKNKMV